MPRDWYSETQTREFDPSATCAHLLTSPNNVWFETPPHEDWGEHEFDPIALRIRESVELLSLQHDWDGSGAHPPSRAAWCRATDFLSRGARILRGEDEVITPPRIVPVADGTIDLEWRTAGVHVLFNFPGDPTAPATYSWQVEQMRRFGKLDETRPDRALRVLL